MLRNFLSRKMQLFFMFLLVISMVVGSVPILANSGVQDKIVENKTQLVLRNINYRNSNGIITKLTANEDVKVSLTVQNLEATPRHMFFSVVLLKDGEFQEVRVDNKAVNQGSTLYSISMTMPADVTGCTLKVMAWENFNTMIPLCNASTFPNNNTKMTKISIDGQVITGLTDVNPNIEYPVTPNRMAPNVEIVGEDLSTRYEITKPEFFPGETKITAIACDGTTKEYKIKYTCADELVSNLAYLGPVGSGSDAWVDASVLVKDLKVGDLMFCDRDALTYKSITTDFPLTGKTYIRPHLNYKYGPPSIAKTAYSTEPKKDWYSFDLMCDADVYIIDNHPTTKPIFIDDTWSKLPTPLSGNFVQYSDGTIYENMFKKSFNLTGAAPLKVTLGNMGENASEPYITVICPKYKTPTTSNLVNIATINEGAVYSIGKDFRSGVKGFGDREWPIKDLDETSNLKGCDFIQMSITDSLYNPDWKAAIKKDWISFDIDKTADIMVFTGFDSTQQADPIFIDSSWTKDTKDTGYFGIDTVKYNTMFTKEYSVPEGGKTTVTLQNLGSAFWAPYNVVIRYK
ncbi:MAG: hypothetical protein RSB38_01765 [Oscillospiraceae bacterium]